VLKCTSFTIKPEFDISCHFLSKISIDRGLSELSCTSFPIKSEFDVSCHILVVRSPYSVIDEFHMLQSMVQRVESLYLEEGHWFLSIYNDDGDSQAVEITISASAQLTGKTDFLKLFFWLRTCELGLNSLSPGLLKECRCLGESSV
jgi:hypothetical protein